MLKILPLTALCALALAGGAARAADTGPQSGAYAVEPNHTEVLFGVKHLGFSTYYGQFPGASGALILDGANPAASQLDVSVPVASVMTANKTLNDELASAQWLDAGKYPAMTFHSTKITMTGPATADVTGDLTLHGVTAPVTLKASFNRGAPNPMNKRYTIGFEAAGKIKRSVFGVATYLPMIGDDVDLILSAAFERKAS